MRSICIVVAARITKLDYKTFEQNVVRITRQSGCSSINIVAGDKTWRSAPVRVSTSNLKRACAWIKQAAYKGKFLDVLKLSLQQSDADILHVLCDDSIRLAGESRIHSLLKSMNKKQRPIDMTLLHANHPTAIDRALYLTRRTQARLFLDGKREVSDSDDLADLSLVTTDESLQVDLPTRTWLKTNSLRALGLALSTMLRRWSRIPDADDSIPSLRVKDGNKTLLVRCSSVHIQDYVNKLQTQHHIYLQRFTAMSKAYMTPAELQRYRRCPLHQRLLNLEEFAVSAGEPDLTLMLKEINKAVASQQQSLDLLEHSNRINDPLVSMLTAMTDADLVGATLLVRWPVDCYLYPARCKGVHDNVGQFTFEHDIEHQLLEMDMADAYLPNELLDRLPSIDEGDYVLAPGTIEGNYMARVPGQVINLTLQPEGTTYRVLTLNNITETYLRDQLVRISTRDHHHLCGLITATLDNRVAHIMKNIENLHINSTQATVPVALGDLDASAIEAMESSMNVAEKLPVLDTADGAGMPIKYRKQDSIESHERAVQTESPSPDALPHSLSDELTSSRADRDASGIPATIKLNPPSFVSTIQRTVGMIGLQDGIEPSSIMGMAAAEHLDILLAKPMRLTANLVQQLYPDYADEIEKELHWADAVGKHVLVLYLEAPGAIARWKYASDKLTDSFYHASQSCLHADREAALLFDFKAVPLRDDQPQPFDIVATYQASLSEAVQGRRILARSGHDGWFYPMTAIAALTDQVITARADNDTTIAVAMSACLLVDSLVEANEPNQEVLCQHPEYREAYLPGRVCKSVSGTLVVAFHDKTAARLSDVTAYVLPRDVRLSTLTDHIKGCEKLTMNTTVIARRERDGLFYTGTIMKLGRTCGHYSIAFDDGTVQEDTPRTYTMHRDGSAAPLLARQFVIARYFKGNVLQYASDIYGPAVVKSVSGSQIDVLFWDGTRLFLDANHCVKISARTHSAAVSLLNSLDQGNQQA